MSLVYVSFAGACGAVLRYVVADWAQARRGSSFPTGTAAVNLVGSLGVGLVAGLAAPGSVLFDLGVGLFGGLTTFSTWMVESLRLGMIPRPRARAMINGALVVAGVGLAAAGYSLGSLGG